MLRPLLLSPVLHPWSRLCATLLVAAGAAGQGCDGYALGDMGSATSPGAAASIEREQVAPAASRGRGTARRLFVTLRSSMPVNCGELFVVDLRLTERGPVAGQARLSVSVGPYYQALSERCSPGGSLPCATATSTVALEIEPDPSLDPHQGCSDGLFIDVPPEPGTEAAAVLSSRGSVPLAWRVLAIAL